MALATITSWCLVLAFGRIAADPRTAPAATDEDIRISERWSSRGVVRRPGHPATHGQNAIAHGSAHAT